MQAGAGRRYGKGVIAGVDLPDDALVARLVHHVRTQKQRYGKPLDLARPQCKRTAAQHKFLSLFDAVEPVGAEGLPHGSRILGVEATGRKGSKTRQADLVRLVHVGSVEVGLAGGRDTVAFACVSGIGEAVGANVVGVGIPVAVVVDSVRPALIDEAVAVVVEAVGGVTRRFEHSDGQASYRRPAPDAPRHPPAAAFVVHVHRYDERAIPIKSQLVVGSIATDRRLSEEAEGGPVVGVDPRFSSS